MRLTPLRIVIAAVAVIAVFVIAFAVGRFVVPGGSASAAEPFDVPRQTPQVPNLEPAGKVPELR